MLRVKHITQILILILLVGCSAYNNNQPIQKKIQINWDAGLPKLKAFVSKKHNKEILNYNTFKSSFEVYKNYEAEIIVINRVIHLNFVSSLLEKENICEDVLIKTKNWFSYFHTLEIREYPWRSTAGDVFLSLPKNRLTEEEYFIFTSKIDEMTLIKIKIQTNLEPSVSCVAKLSQFTY